MVKEYWAGLAGEVWPKTIRLVHNRTLLHNATKTAAERRWVFKAPLQEELRKMPHIIETSYLPQKMPGLPRMRLSDGCRAGLGPALSAVLPSRSASGWLRGRNLRLRDADGLLRSGRAGRQRRLRGYRIGTGFIAVGKQRGGHAQCLDFLFHSGQLQFFLPQNFINILHTRPPLREHILRPN